MSGRAGRVSGRGCSLSFLGLAFQLKAPSLHCRWLRKHPYLPRTSLCIGRGRERILPGWSGAIKRKKLWNWLRQTFLLLRKAQQPKHSCFQPNPSWRWLLSFSIGQSQFLTDARERATGAIGWTLLMMKEWGWIPLKIPRCSGTTRVVTGRPSRSEPQCRPQSVILKQSCCMLSDKRDRN